MDKEIKILIDDKPLIRTIDENAFAKILGYANAEVLQQAYPAVVIYQSFMECIMAKIGE